MRLQSSQFKVLTVTLTLQDQCYFFTLSLINIRLVTSFKGGHLEVCQLLFSYGADVDSQDNRKVSILMAAFRKGHIKVVKWLVKHVHQFPSDSECTRFVSTLSDKVRFPSLEIVSMSLTVPGNILIPQKPQSSTEVQQMECSKEEMVKFIVELIINTLLG